MRDAGLVMQATFSVAELPAWVVDPLAAAGVVVGDFQNLVLLGQGGPALWKYIEKVGVATEHPFDDTSRRLAESFVVDHLGGPAWQVVYPGPALLPLGRLAELAGWGRASPLGLTINDEYGLWLAHRVAFVVDAPLPVIERPSSSHPCDSCDGKPCVSACPVGAVDAHSGFDVVACSEFRVLEGSACALQCLARLACPVGVEHRYGTAQMTHHYASGLASIRRYLNSS